MTRETIAAKVRDQKWSDKLAAESGTPATYHVCRSCNQPARTTRPGRAFCGLCGTVVTTPAIPTTDKIIRAYVSVKRRSVGFR